MPAARSFSAAVVMASRSCPASHETTRRPPAASDGSIVKLV